MLFYKYATIFLVFVEKKDEKSGEIAKMLAKIVYLFY